MPVQLLDESFPAVFPVRGFPGWLMLCVSVKFMLLLCFLLPMLLNSIYFAHFTFFPFLIFLTKVRSHCNTSSLFPLSVWCPLLAFLPFLSNYYSRWLAPATARVLVNWLFLKAKVFIIRVRRCVFLSSVKLPSLLCISSYNLILVLFVCLFTILFPLTWISSFKLKSYVGFQKILVLFHFSPPYSG